jgi:5-methyltetrahydropteroyltriglutamate--homocysteine methyltransferase
MKIFKQSLRECGEMMFDDIGSFPLPEGINREVLKNLNLKEYEEMVQRAFLLKVKAGVECPNYPQFQEMVEQFLGIIRNPEFQEDAYLISKDVAVIRELKAIEGLGHNVRVCITGPFELYYKEFGTRIYEDLLENIAISASRFAENSLKTKLRVCAISIDEPSLGTNPELQPTPEQLRLAFKHFDFSCDVQIHLHSPLYYSSLLDVEEIDVLGVEAAKDCKVLGFIDKNDLESYEKRLRIGVARSDIDGIVALYNQKHNTNAWKDVRLLKEAIEEIESVDVIKKRIEKAYRMFEDKVAYIGPDCGLFSFPNQECASLLLNNVRKAVDEFRADLRWIT